MRTACLPFLVLAAAAFAQNPGDAQLPAGVRAVWDANKAYRESTSTRERISINGLWRWQPAAGTATEPPAGGWGYLRVPQSWPGGARNTAGQVFFPHAGWDRRGLAAATSAWQQREISIPAAWSGRRIALYAEYVNSYAEVYVDGRKAGAIAYPSGELDLTGICRPGRTYVLSLLVAAKPLRALTLAHNDTAAPRTVEAKVERRGLCGDVYLVGTPPGARVDEVKVETSVRRWEIAVSAALTALDADASYVLRAQVKDGGRVVKEFSRAFKPGDADGGRIAIAAPWRPEKLWDTHTPRNQYEVSVSLLRGEKLLDEALPVRFGFREFWIDGRDFYLNGSRIYLSALPLDNGQLSSIEASYEATRATLQHFRSFGINFVYTHNYGCEPGSHLSFSEVLRAADDEGMLVSFSQPHFNHYDWTATNADTANGYARHAEFYVRVARNHPSVILYSMSHNATGYSDDMNPDRIDGVEARRDRWGERSAARALRAEAIVRKLDPSRSVYHHSSGNLGSMHVINFYGNWIPVQEMSDWFTHWATKGVKPLFTCEYSVPFLWDWSMYRGWYQGKREFGSAAVPWEFAVAEWDAQFLGDRAYRIGDAEKANLRWEAGQFRRTGKWKRWDYPQSLNSQVFEDRFQVIAAYLTDNWRAFRALGVSANSPWEAGSYWKRPAAPNLDLDVDWDGLQRPGPRPAFVKEDEARARLAYRPGSYAPTAAATALQRNNMPLLGFIAGKPAAFTSKDHNFLPGEWFEKQLLAINNSRVAVACDAEWSLRLPVAAAGRTRFTLPTGEQKRIPLRFDLPKNLAPGRYELRAAFRFGTAERQEDSFWIDVMPPAGSAVAAAKIALFDPKGGTAQLLERLGVRYARVEAGADLAGYDVLLVGKGALSVQGKGPDLSRVRDGLKVAVFEQTGQVLEQRFGFRIAEYGLRQVFRRIPGHPLLAGVRDEHLRDWRGEASTLPPRLEYEVTGAFNFVPTVKWAGITVPRVWRAGNRGSVASALIEKPARGDFLPIVEGGFSLQYSPLIEYREGRGMVLFCQLDVNGRSESDPAGDALARNIVRYAAAWKPLPARTAVYAGNAAGADYLRKAGVAFAAYSGGAPAAGQVLIAGPGAGTALSAHAGAIGGWLKTGGRALAIGLDQAEANAFLPGKVEMAAREHIAAYFEPFAPDSVFAGISPGEVMNRSPRIVPLVERGATAVGNGVLAEGAGVVYWQLAPWQFDYSGEQMNVKRTFRRVACATSRLLGNLGVTAQTPLLARFASPASLGERRWLDGLYLDVPEEWDDPYRFFRW